MLKLMKTKGIFVMECRPRSSASEGCNLERHFETFFSWGRYN
jgi:hypothetical protein